MIWEDLVWKNLVSENFLVGGNFDVTIDEPFFLFGDEFLSSEVPIAVDGLEFGSIFGSLGVSIVGNSGSKVG